MVFALQVSSPYRRTESASLLLDDFKSFYFCLLSKGPFTDINSEEVEEEIGSMYRTVLKLTKTFGDAPGPRRVADSVKSKIDKFKVHIPLLQIICNPGLRERHWEQVKGMSTLLIDIFGGRQYCRIQTLGEGGRSSRPVDKGGASPPLDPPLDRTVISMWSSKLHFFLSAFRKLSIGQAPGIELAQPIFLRINQATPSW